MVADAGYAFASLYVGGGTPTVLVDELCDTFDLARALFGPLEVSCETNPEPSDAPRDRRLDATGGSPLGGRPELRRRVAQADAPLRQVRQRRGHLRRSGRRGGAVPSAQRGSDLQLPEPDRGHAGPRHRPRRGVRRRSGDVLPADGFAGHAAVAGADGRCGELPPRGQVLPSYRRRSRVGLRALFGVVLSHDAGTP